MLLNEKSLQCRSLLLILNVKLQSCFYKTAITATFMPVSLASAWLAVTSCISSLSSFEAFNDSVQQLLPSFVTTKRMLIAYGILTMTDNALD